MSASAIQSVLSRSVGLKKRIKKAFQAPPNAHFDMLHQRLLGENRLKERVVFDVGAHTGQSIARFHKVFPKAKIHAFEADSENFRVLNNNFGEQSFVQLNNFGVGREKTMKTFYRNKKSSTSSFIPVDQDSSWLEKRSRQRGVSKDAFTQKEYDVQLIDLDSYAAENAITHIDLLKIDTQGFEEEVLCGASGLLKDQEIDVIETELIVGEAYQSNINFYHLESLLVPAGYKFFAIDKAGDLLSASDLCFNLLYVSAPVFERYQKMKKSGAA